MASTGKHWRKRDWRDREDQVKALKKLASRFGKPASALTAQDLRANGLGYLLRLHNERLYTLLLDLRLIRSPFEMTKLPKDLLDEPRWAHRLVCNAVRTTGKRVRDLLLEDFREVGVSPSTIIRSGGMNGLLRRAGFRLKPWEIRGGVPIGYWRRQSHRRETVRWVVRTKLAGRPQLLTKAVLEKYHLGALLQYRRIAALREEAGYHLSRGEAKQVPMGYWSSRRNVRKVLEELLSHTGKATVRELFVDDFSRLRLGGLLDYYNANLFRICRKGGYRVLRADFNRPFFGKYRRAQWLVSRHGHCLRSYGERRCDDLLWEAGFRKHEHEVHYPGGSLMRCDTVTKDGKTWFEYVGMLERKVGTKIEEVQHNYSRKLRKKQRILRRLGIPLVVVRKRDLDKPDAVAALRRKVESLRRVHCDGALQIRG